MTDWIDRNGALLGYQQFKTYGKTEQK